MTTSRGIPKIYRGARNDDALSEHIEEVHGRQGTCLVP